MFRLALKNILYYKGRTITTFILTFISTFFFIVYVAMMDGSHGSMLKNALKVYTGPIEVYAKGYRDIGGNDYLLQNVDKLKEDIKAIKGVSDVSSRYESYGLFSFKEYAAAALIGGIEPEKEAKYTQLKQALTQGEFLNSSSKNCLYMGDGLFKKLHLTLDDTLSFVGSAVDNSFVAELFTVCGVFKTGSFAFDSASTFISKKQLDIIMMSENQASYLSVQIDNLNEAQTISHIIAKILPEDYESLDWKILMHSMVQAMEVDSVFGYISIALFFVVIFFVILIFGFINISSRTRELGTLRCIGLSKNHIRTLLFYEIFIISTLAILIATPLGSYIAYYFSVHPIVIEGVSETYKEYGIVSDEIPLSFDTFTIAWNVIFIYVLNFLSIIYPLHYVTKMKPIEASKHV